MYGSQTGNGKRIAERLGRTAEASGLAVRVYSASNYPVKDLARERLLVVVMSTHGDGDPPDDARSFIEHLQSKARTEARAAVRRACARRLELSALLRDGTPGARPARAAGREAVAAVRRCDVD